MSEELLRVERLSSGFRDAGRVRAVVDEVSFVIAPGETFALVGESGSGKSITALSVMRLLPPGARLIGGEASLRGLDLLRTPERSMGRIRGRRIGMIFQDPQTSLNPVATIGDQIGEVLALHLGLRGRARTTRTLELLAEVGLPDPARQLAAFPHQLSGGMRQRVMIAIALAGQPELLIADEPTTALDVTIAAQILALLKGLQRKNGMGLWLITHDLGVVAEMADHVAVMKEGRIVEEANAKTFFAAPVHPYSRRLLELLPRISACRRETTHEPSPPILQLREFSVAYPVRKGLLQRVVNEVKAVDRVSFEVHRGRTLALVGESGCGKTTLGKAVLGLIPSTGGSAVFEGDLLEARGDRRSPQFRRDAQIVFQDPFASMNPRMLVGDVIDEGIAALHGSLPRSERLDRVVSLLRSVGLPAEARVRYPHEFSGGQRQRICIARALAVSPKLIVCDEPTSALDVSVQAQILELLAELQQTRELSYLFISHDLGVVASLAHEVAVMRRGKIVEIGATDSVLLAPRHEYTRALLASVPALRRS